MTPLPVTSPFFLFQMEEYAVEISAVWWLLRSAGVNRPFRMQNVLYGATWDIDCRHGYQPWTEWRSSCRIVGWVGSSIKRFVGISVNNVPPTQTIHLSGCPQVHEANMSIIKEIRKMTAFFCRLRRITT